MSALDGRQRDLVKCEDMRIWAERAREFLATRSLEEFLADAMAQAADAAEKGAASTQDLAARFGRARNVGEQTLGHADPGATSVSLLFRGFAQALAR